MISEPPNKIPEYEKNDFIEIKDFKNPSGIFKFPSGKKRGGVR